MNSMGLMEVEQTLIEEPQFRHVLGHFASGVTVVTVAHENVIQGMTVSSFTSVSLNPPLVLVCLNKGCRTHPLVSAAGHLAVNILRAEQHHWSDRFAGRHPEIKDRFFDIAWRTEVTGAPIFEDCLAWLDCRVVAPYDGGDHTIFVAEAIAGDIAVSGESMIYYQGRYRKLAPDGVWITR